MNFPPLPSSAPRGSRERKESTLWTCSICSQRGGEFTCFFFFILHNLLLVVRDVDRRVGDVDPDGDGGGGAAAVVDPAWVPPGGDRVPPPPPPGGIPVPLRGRVEAEEVVVVVVDPFVLAGDGPRGGAGPRGVRVAPVVLASVPLLVLPPAFSWVMVVAQLICHLSVR